MDDSTPRPPWTSAAAYSSAGIVILAAALLGVRLVLGPPVSSPNHPSRLIVEFLDVLASASVAPLAYAFHQTYTRSSTRLGRLAMSLGFTSSAGGVALNGLFFAGVLEFGNGLWVNVAFFAGLVIQGGWLVLGGIAAQKSGRLPHGTLMGIVGAVGYPVWAMWIGWRASHPLTKQG